ncbi:MAG TPA: hypothetical protein VF813_04260 [Anaerolineaceae bacterium]
MEPIDTLQQAIDFVRSGDKASASRLLAKYVTQAPNEDIAWMWLAASLDQPDQQLYCLKKAQSINPSNPGTIQELNSYLGLTAPAPEEEEYPINLPPPPPPAPEPELETEPPQPEPEPARVVEPPAAPAAVQSPAPAPAAKPDRVGMTGIQIVILAVLIIAILLVAAVLGYIVFGGSMESLPPFLRSLLGTAILFP